jgi:hypothetical protein
MFVIFKFHIFKANAPILTIDKEGRHEPPAMALLEIGERTI